MIPAATAPSASLADAVWLRRSDTQAVLAMLNTDGGEARIVGGAVRNELLAKPVADIDIATTLDPQAVMARALRAGMKAAPTGLAHGTVTVIVGQHGFEVTTLREDVETFGRHAKVAFTADWTADARRRDFTMNALYCDARGCLYDPVDGYRDLIDGRVRFIGDPAARIGEDYLRILRLFRFHAQYGRREPDQADLDACVRLKAGLGTLSRERIRAELMRLLVAPGVVSTLRQMQGLAILTEILPVAPRRALLAALATIEHELDGRPDAALRLAALAMHGPDDTERLVSRLTLSNAERRTLIDAGLVLARGNVLPSLAPDTAEVEVLVYRNGNAAAKRTVLFGWALSASGGAVGDTVTNWRLALATAESFVAPRFPLTGHDVQALGIRPGPELGRIMRRIEAAWVASRFSLDETALRSQLDGEINAKNACQST